MFRLLLSCVAVTALGAVASASATAAPCNDSLRLSQSSEALPAGSTYLPACMAFEMVTPPKKFGQETHRFTAFSADGERALFVSKAALADTEALQSFGGDSYVAVRAGGGWQVFATSAPRSANISSGGQVNSLALAKGGAFTFSPGLDAWAIYGATQLQRFSGESQFFAGGLDGSFAPVSPLLTAVDDSGIDRVGLLTTNLNIRGTAADARATVFAAAANTTSYLPGDPQETSGDPNSYLAFDNALGQPSLQLLARDEAGKVWGGRCGAFLGGNGGGLNQGAISPDGSRIFFSTRPAQAFDPAHPTEALLSPPCNAANPLRILVRNGEGPEIKELIPGAPSAPGDDLYQGASQDGTKVLLTSPRKLTASDLDPSAEACSANVGASKGCDLYLYDSTLPEGSRLIQASAGGNGDPTPGQGANVLSSVAAVSADGSHAYFAAQGVLTTDPNPEGDSAVAGQPNLYLYERDEANPGGHTAFIATLAGGDKGSLWGGGQSLAGGAYPVPLAGAGDGHILFFLSKASLVGDDEDAGHTDVYRYDSTATATLQCVSCVPGGDAYPGDAFANSTEESTGSNFAEQGRWAADDGNTTAFATEAPLVPSDEDEDVNIYFWREGGLYELPSQISGEARPFKLPAVSTSGNQVGFTTRTAILPIDGDSTRDAYVARVDGGFPNPAPPTPCDPLVEGACQGAPTSPGSSLTPASNTIVTSGNPKAPAKCKQGFVRKQGKCTKKKQTKHKKAKGKKRANDKRGGSK